MSFFNQPSIANMNFKWTTKHESLLELCIVQYVEMKRVFTFQPIKRLVSTTVKSAKPAATMWKFLLRTENLQFCCLAVTIHNILQAQRVATLKKKIYLHDWRKFSANQIHAQPNLNQKRQEIFPLWYYRVDTPLVDTVNQNFNYILILYTFSLLESSMILSVSNDGIEWFLNFGADSVVLTVKDLVQQMTISSQENLVAA